VRGAVSVARRFGLSSLLIGLTLVAAGTSAPELLVSVSAALQGNADIAIGNVVGSNIFNVLAVLGVSALIAPIVVKPAEVRRDTFVMAGAMIALAVISLSGLITRPIGVLLVLALVGYTYYSYRTELREKPAPSAELHEHEGEEFAGPGSLWLGVLYIALGLGALVIGSDLLITGATGIARAFGVPETVIGLTLVAVGTSLPELATSIAAAFRGHSDVAVGNVLGSNIFNALLIIGTTATIRPIGVATGSGTRAPAATGMARPHRPPRRRRAHRRLCSVRGAAACVAPAPRDRASTEPCAPTDARPTTARPAQRLARRANPTPDRLHGRRAPRPSCSLRARTPRQARRV